MSAEIYVTGEKIDKESVNLPLNSCAVLFTIHYCQLKDITLHFVQSLDVNKCLINIKIKELNCLNINFTTYNKIPSMVKICSSPVLVTSRSNLIRSGLCNVIRQIARIADNLSPSENFTDLLGFRGGSLKACAEVSSWTKLCEIEFPEAMMTAIHQLRLMKPKIKDNIKEVTGSLVEFELPKETVLLEHHLYRPPRIHNDDKMKRYLVQSLIRTWTNDVNDASTSEHSLDVKICRETEPIVGELFQPHAIIRFRLEGLSRNDLSEDQQQALLWQSSLPSLSPCKPSTDGDIGDIEGLMERIRKMRLDDIILEHLYVEGIEMTVADLMLFIFVYHFLEVIDFQFELLSIQLPKLSAWFHHMTKMPKVHSAALKYGCNLEALESPFECQNPFISKFILPEVCEEETQVSELQRRTRSKYRALKPELARVLKLVKMANIHPRIGEHPCGTEINLSWDTLPRAIHPHEGGLPEKRALKKCQQLGNLVTAIKKIAKSGQIIVDFCSGGGHLGIAIASLIPYCQVYLIENKEESLLIAKTRVDKLHLKNITLYQCNLGYFHGKFDIGTCLHACGVATDMVLQKCMNSDAAFVICPCCYGAVQNTHLINYPRSQLFQNANISDKDLLILGHAADQTEFKIALEEQGRYCMNLVDTDRLYYAAEKGYDITLCSLLPLTCTPKNNLLIGVPTRNSMTVNS